MSLVSQPFVRCVSDSIVNLLNRGGGFKSENDNAKL
jgi:hypothetical protein